MHALFLAALTADILLAGGRVLDGAGNPWVRADLAIREDRIVFIGDARAAGVEARETVDVGGGQGCYTEGTTQLVDCCCRLLGTGHHPREKVGGTSGREQRRHRGLKRGCTTSPCCLCFPGSPLRTWFRTSMIFWVLLLLPSIL